MHLLIVEDNIEVRSRIAAHLLELGLVDRVTTAGTIEEALTQLAEPQFDVVLLDLKLPDGSGLALLKSLRRRGDLPVIVWTGLATPQYRRWALGAGASYFFEKETPLGELEAAFRAISRGRRRPLRVVALEGCGPEVTGAVAELERVGFAPRVETARSAEQLATACRRGVDLVIGCVSSAIAPPVARAELSRAGAEAPFVVVGEPPEAAEDDAAGITVPFDDLARLGPMVAAFLAVRDARPRTPSSWDAERFLAVAQAGTIPVTFIDQDGMFLWWSAAPDRVLGYDRAQMVGRSCFDVIHPDDLTHILARFQVLVSEPGARLTTEVRVRDATGAYRWLEITGENQLANERIRAVVSTFRDMSAHRRLEELVVSAQRLEALGRLAGGVAHDVNNLVTTILGATSMLQRAELPPDALDEVSNIRLACEHAADLTGRLLGRGSRSLATTRVASVQDVVSETLRLVGSLIGHDITVKTEHAPMVPPAKMARGALLQVVLNLILNARDAMPAGGTLTVQSHADDEAVILIVADTGVGMDEETRRRLFEPFFTTKADQGTGMGLATVDALLKEHGATIEVASRPDVGTTFTIRLPADGGTKRTM